MPALQLFLTGLVAVIIVAAAVFLMVLLRSGMMKGKD